MLFSPGGTARPGQDVRRADVQLVNPLGRVDRRRNPQVGILVVHDVKQIAADEVRPIQNLRIETADVVRPIRHGIAGLAELADVVPQHGIGVGDWHGRLLSVECWIWIADAGRSTQSESESASYLAARNCLINESCACSTSVAPGYFRATCSLAHWWALANESLLDGHVMRFRHGALRRRRAIDGDRRAGRELDD